MKAPKKLSADQVDIAMNELMGWENVRREDYWLGDMVFTGIRGNYNKLGRGTCYGYCEGNRAAINLLEAQKALLVTDKDAKAFDRAVCRLMRTRKRIPSWRLEHPVCALAILMVKKPELFK